MRTSIVLVLLVIIGGTAVTITFTSSQAAPRIGILSAEEGRFVAGKSWRAREALQASANATRSA
jgi:hypothetical protein